MSETLNSRNVARKLSAADLRTEFAYGNPGVDGQPYFEPTTGQLEVSRGQHRQINMQALQSLPADRFRGYHAIQTPRIPFQLPSSDQADGTTTDISNEVVHPSIVVFDRPWNGYKYWMCITPYPATSGPKENPSIVATNDDTLATWVEPYGVTNPVAPFPAGSQHQADVYMVYDTQRDMLVVIYQNDMAASREMRTIESSDGVNWSAPVVRLTLGLGITTPCLIEYINSSGARKYRLIYNQNSKVNWREADSIYGIAGSWQSVTEVVSACILPRERMVWDFQCWRLASGEWLFCQTLGNTALTATECYFGYSTDDMVSIQYDPAPKLCPAAASGNAWATDLIYTTSLIAKVTNGVPTFDGVATGKSATVWGGMSVSFEPRDEFANPPIMQSEFPRFAAPKTGTISTAKYRRSNADSLGGWSIITGSVTSGPDGLTFSTAQNGWLRQDTSYTANLTDWTAMVRFRIDKDPATATAGQRIGLCSIGGIHVAAIRHASGAAWQIEIVTYVSTTATSRLLAETLPGSFGEFMSVAITKSGDVLYYASDTDNDLLASTVSFAWTMTNTTQVGQAAIFTPGDVTVSDFTVWGESLHPTNLNRLVRRNGLISQKKNLILNSENLSGTSWVPFRATVAADKISATATALTHGIGTTCTLRRGIPYIYSVKLKAAGIGYAGLLIDNMGTFFDLNTGVVMGDFTAAPYQSWIEDLGSGWYRCSVCIMSTLGGSVATSIYMATDGVTYNFTGDGISGILVGNAQLAQNEYAPITYHKRLGA